jgi:hypothetical protein
MARTLLAATMAISALVAFVRPADAHEDGSLDEVALVADEAGVSPVDLRGAVITLGITARAYMESVGELAPPIPPVGQAGAASISPPGAASVSTPPQASGFDRRIDCLVRYESGGNPNAVNRSSGAAGLLQFLPSTWAGTPQGRAGLSVFNPQAARAAAAWMLAQGRAREWVPVRQGLC